LYTHSLCPLPDEPAAEYGGGDTVSSLWLQQNKTLSTALSAGVLNSAAYCHISAVFSASISFVSSNSSKWGQICPFSIFTAVRVNQQTIFI